MQLIEDQILQEKKNSALKDITSSKMKQREKKRIRQMKTLSVRCGTTSSDLIYV